MASGPVTSWQIDGETVETVSDFIFLGSKITADGDCSHEIKRRLFFGRKVMTDLDSILKSRDITLSTKVCLVKAMVFPLVMHRCKSWTIKSWVPKNWCFWTVVLEKTLQSPLDCKEIQPVHSKEISPGCSLEGMMLKLKLQYFGHLMRRVDSLEKTLCWEGLGAGGEGDDRRWDGWMASLTQWTWIWVNSGSWWWKRRPGMLQSWGHKESDTTERLNWTEHQGCTSSLCFFNLYAECCCRC